MEGLPTELPSPSRAVLARLRLQGLLVRSVWFPTKRELEDWGRSGVPLYFRPVSPTRWELGPRLSSMWASVFSPVWVCELQDAEGGCTVQWKRRFPKLTVGVLFTWSTVLALWGASLLTSIEPNGAPFWSVLAMATVLAPLVGWIRGGRALKDGIPWLSAILLAEDEEEDW